MPDNSYKPVPIDSSKAIAKAAERPGFSQAWEALEEEYSALNALLNARKTAGLTQEDVANRMGTTKSAISRLESSLRHEKHSPSFATLKKYANACGKKLVLQLI
jgi:DNA-binding XRE family transcriptional regulator